MCGGICDRQGMLSPGPVRMYPWCVDRLDAFIAEKQREVTFWSSIVAMHIVGLACCAATVVMVVWYLIAA